jgi:hypothetical protein
VQGFFSKAIQRTSIFVVRVAGPSACHQNNTALHSVNKINVERTLFPVEKELLYAGIDHVVKAENRLRKISLQYNTVGGRNNLGL